MAGTWSDGKSKKGAVVAIIEAEKQSAASTSTGSVHAVRSCLSKNYTTLQTGTSKQDMGVAQLSISNQLNRHMNALTRASNEREFPKDSSSQIDNLKLGFANLAEKVQLGGAAMTSSPLILHATSCEGSQAPVYFLPCLNRITSHYHFPRLH
jgi:hypothetical protein